MRDDQNTPSPQDDSSEDRRSRRDKRRQRWEQRRNDRLSFGDESVESDGSEEPSPEDEASDSSPGHEATQSDRTAREEHSDRGGRAGSDRASGERSERPPANKPPLIKPSQNERATREKLERQAPVAPSQPQNSPSGSRRETPVPQAPDRKLGGSAGNAKTNKGIPAPRDGAPQRKRAGEPTRSRRQGAWNSLRSPWLRRQRDPWSQTRRHTQTVLRRTLRQSVTAKWASTAFGWMSPSKLAVLPELLGRVSCRIRARQTHHKQLAIDFYRSFHDFKPFDIRKPFAPLWFLGRRTVLPILVGLWIILGDLISRLLAAMGETGKVIGGGFAFLGSLLIAPATWWKRLLASADHALAAGTNQDQDVSTAWSSYRESDDPDRRSALWALVALTGVAGVILTFILQFRAGGPKPQLAAAEDDPPPKAAALQIVELPPTPIAPKRPKLEYPISRKLDYPITKKKKVERDLTDLPPGEDLLPPLEEPEGLRIVNNWDETPLRKPEPEPVREPVPPPVEPKPTPPELEPEIQRVARTAAERPLPRSEEFLVKSRPENAVPGEPAGGVPADVDRWSLAARRTDRHDPVAVVSYERRVHPLDREKLETDLKRELAVGKSTHAATDVQLSVTKRSPQQSAPTEAVWYELVVRNDGREELPQVLVEDRIPESYEVVSVSPLGLLKDRTLRWQLGRLAAGDEQTLRVELMPRGEGVLETTSLVRSFAAVNFQTDVAGPKLKLDVTVPDRFRVGERVPIKFRVTNNGSAPATNVVLQEELPAELAHRHGRKLDLDLGTIPPGESRDAHLTVDAANAGNVVLRSTVVASEGNRDDVPSGLLIAEAPPAPREERRPEPRSPRPRPQPPAPRAQLLCVPTPICVP